MQVGDLVTLSAYGKRVQRTGWVKDGDIGIVTKASTVSGWSSYTVMWNQSITRPSPYNASHANYKTRGSSWEWSISFDRRDLKFVK